MTEEREPGRHAVKIWLMSDTREALKTLGRKGESYDVVIRRLLEERRLRMERLKVLDELDLKKLEKEAEDR